MYSAHNTYFSVTSLQRICVYPINSIEKRSLSVEKPSLSKYLVFQLNLVYKLSLSEKIVYQKTEYLSDIFPMWLVSASVKLIYKVLITWRTIYSTGKQNHVWIQVTIIAFLRQAGPDYFIYFFQSLLTHIMKML